MATAGNISAVLSLNATPFQKGLNTSIEAVNTFVASVNKLSSTKASLGLERLNNDLIIINKSLKAIGDTNNNAINSFSKLSTAINKMANGLKILSSDTIKVDQGINTMNSIFKAFQGTLNGIEVKIKGVSSSLNSLNTTNQKVRSTNTSLSTSFKSLQSDFWSLYQGINRYGEIVTQAEAKVRYETQTTAERVKSQMEMMKQEYRSARKELLEFANGGVQAFNKIATNSNKATQAIRQIGSALQGTSSIINNQSGQFSRLKSSIDQTSNSYRMLRINEEGENVTLEKSSLALQKNSAEMLKNAEAKLRAMGYTGQLSNTEQRLANAERQVASSSTQATSSILRQSSASNTATNSTNRFASATSRLGKVMSSLRMMGSLVGSMLAYNFAHKLLVATGETIHAKSEMEGYFKMLNFGQKDIDGFNKALDRTVSQFQRVNKYSLGETISSIGVEFNLSTKEMEKAMKVTSMITSEYLRAGRNANEASLAVKDVLQGQFQRLSRETGVKGEQLKEAGWSGDTTDVLGLMEALEKVGKSRNWDVFAEKANSLNDILTITQNRFGEWSADLVYSVQPAIVGAFNMMSGTAQKFASVLSGVWEWLNGDSMDGQIAKWGLLATAITGVASAFVVYRTGANLVQIAQMGLTRTIASTVLGLQAEQVAESGLTATIVSRITGLKAEQVATMGVQRAIMTKVLGLNAEKVATMGLKGAIGEEVLARRIQEATMKGASAQHMTMIYTEYQEQMAKRGTLATIMAKVLGLDMEIFAEEGLFVAIQKRMAQSSKHIVALIGEQMATMGTAEATLFLVATLGSLLAIVGLVVVAIGSWAIALKDSADEMKRFNDIVDHGADTVKENRKTLETYTQRQKSLQDTLAKTTEGTQKYHDTQAKLRAVNQDIITSTKNIENNYKALQIATSAQNHYDEARTDIVIHQQEKIAQAYMKAGFSAEESYEMANESIRDAEAGAEQLRLTLQKLQSASDFSSAKIEEFTKQFEDAGIKDKDTIKKYTQDYLSARDIYQQGLEKSLTDDSFFGRLDGYLGMLEGSVKFTIKEWEIDWQTGDADELWKDFWNNFGQNFGGLGGLNSIARMLGIDELWKGLKITDVLKNINLPSAFINWLIPELQKIGDYIKGKNLMELIGLDPNKDYIGDFFNWIFSLGDSIDFSWATDFINNNIITPLTTAWNNFMADPLGTIGGLVMNSGIGGLISALLGNGDGSTAIEWAMTYVTENIITPLQNAFSMFMADPMSYITNFIGTGGLIGILFPSDGGLGIWEWTNTNIIQPFGQALWNGITSIPLVSDILALFGLVNGENSGSAGKGRDLGESFKTAIENKIRSIPILGDILTMLGVIPQANGDAHSKGHDVGDNIKRGEQSGHQGIADNIKIEMGNLINAISQKAGEAYSVAHDVGSQIVKGIKDAMDMHSPSIISRELIANEFGVYIPQAITNSGDVAYSSAQYYGQQIRDGISSVNTDTVGFGSMVGEYETDAQTIATTSEMMGIETTTAFDNMNLAVNTTTSTMANAVGTTYSQMQQKQNTSLQSMKMQNLNAYNDMYLKSNQSLIQMRDSTTNVTHQMVNAWTHMKTQLVATASALRNESTTHFNTLSNTIGAFYRKIQNPSNWGAGGGSGIPTRVARNSTVGRSFARSIKTRSATHHGAGGSSASPYFTNRKTMTLRQLKQMICPSGSCDIFDGYDLSQTVNVADFLSTISGEHGFGWSGWNTTHYNHIKNTSDKWDMKSPVIQLVGGIPTNTNFKVGDFENGTPKISFGSFQSMAESIFTAIPYRFYYDSSWKGSWLGALQAGACNCADGADALIAFANACGFSGYRQHGQWRDPSGKTYGHFWAVINGHKMDTTGWQQRRTWTPSASAGSPMVRRATHTANDTMGRTVNINVDMSNSTIYGVDELDSRIEEATKRAMREEFNDPYSVAL